MYHVLIFNSILNFRGFVVLTFSNTFLCHFSCDKSAKRITAKKIDLMLGNPKNYYWVNKKAQVRQIGVNVQCIFNETKNDSSKLNKNKKINRFKSNHSHYSLLDYRHLNKRNIAFRFVTITFVEWLIIVHSNMKMTLEFEW